MVYVLGLMERNMMDSGKIIRNMEQGLIPGQMEGFTRVVIAMTKNMGMELTLGQMIVNILVNGKMIKDMVKAST
jgi:hypothetical protein